MGAPTDLEKGAAVGPEPQKPAAFNTGGPAAYNSGAPAYPPMVQVRPTAQERHVLLTVSPGLSLALHLEPGAAPLLAAAAS